MHYQRFMKYGDPLGGGRFKTFHKVCTIPGCGQPNYGHGLCEVHWHRQRRNGHPELAVRRAPEITVVGATAYVPLTKGLVAAIDAKDVHLIAGCTWSALKGKHTVYAVSATKGAVTMMHRVILGLNDDALDVDHQDRNGLNNRRENLRVASRSQNCAARGLFKSNTVGFKGVRQLKGDERWYAVIGKDGHRHKRTGFATSLEAALAYDEMAIELYGEFARTNASMGLIPPQ